MWLKLSGPKEFLPDRKLINELSQQLCNGGRIRKIICSNLLFINVGYNREQLNMTMLPVINGHVPAGTSTKLIQHLSQIRSSGIFRQFDHGLAKNLLRYKHKLPFKYNLANVNALVTTYTSNNDWLAPPGDVHQLIQELANVFENNQINKSFSHMDFVWGIDAPEIIWNNMINFLDKRGN